MNDLVIGLYGVYLLMVGLAGNGQKTIAAVQQDGKGFLPWGISLAVLAVLYNVDETRPVAKPFIGLLILSFVLKNWKKLSKESQTIWGMAMSPAQQEQTK